MADVDQRAASVGASLHDAVGTGPQRPLPLSLNCPRVGLCAEQCLAEVTSLLRRDHKKPAASVSGTLTLAGSLSPLDHWLWGEQAVTWSAGLWETFVGRN